MLGSQRLGSRSFWSITGILMIFPVFKCGRELRSPLLREYRGARNQPTPATVPDTFPPFPYIV